MKHPEFMTNTKLAISEFKFSNSQLLCMIFSVHYQDCVFVAYPFGVTVLCRIP